MPNETLESSSTPETEDWAPVWILIDELKRIEQGEHWAGPIYQWDLLVRLFRAIEQRKLIENEPTKTDLKIHQALLHALIDLGEHVLFRIKRITDEELSYFGINRENLSAYIRDLQDTYLMFHGAELEPARKAELEKAIFG